MAPTIMVGDGENAGDVAARLLSLADNQRHVKVRTDLARPAFDVPDELYEKFVKDAGDRPDDEQRLNDQPPGGDPTGIEGDELPGEATNAEPGEGDITAPVEGDDLPAEATNAEPPSNGDTNDHDDDEAEEPPAPKKRTRAAKKTTPTAESK